MSQCVQTIITNQPLPGDERVILRKQSGGRVQAFVHRPSLRADPDGVLSELLHLADTNRCADLTRWLSVAS